MTLKDAGVEGPVRGRFAEAIERQEQIFKDSFPGMLGVRIVEVSEGYARAELTVDERVVHPGGVAHGGALAGFGDTVAAWATFPNLDEGQLFSTIDFKASFISAGLPGETLVGEGKVLHQGRRTMVIEVSIRAAGKDGRLVCVMLVTQAILDPGKQGAHARY